MKKQIISLIISIILLLAGVFSISAGAKTTSLNSVKGFKCTQLTSERVNLKWNKVSKAKAYIIYRYNYSAHKWVRYRVVKTNSTAFSKLTPATRYAFAVKAYKSKKVMSAHFPKLVLNTKLNSVTVLKSSPACHKVVLSWNRLSKAEGYILYKYDNNSNKWERFLKLNSTLNTYTVNNLQSNTTYAFALRGYKSVAKKEVLSEKTVTCTAKTLKPSISNAQMFTAENKIRLSWDALKDAAKYNIYLFDAEAEQWVFKTATMNNYYLITRLNTSSVYKLGVVPVKKSGVSDIDDMATVEGMTLPGIVSFSVDENDEGLTIKWKKRTDADKYIVYTKIPKSEWESVCTTDSTSCTIKALDAEKYYVTVKAIKYYKGKAVAGNFTKKLVLKSYSGTLYSNGDSIAYGSGSSGYSYAALFAENHSLKLTSKAVAGGTLCSSVEGVYHIAENTLKTVNNSYDIIFLEGGVNDYSQSAPLGIVTDDFESELDINTTCGALEMMLKYVKLTCPDSKIYYIISNKIINCQKPNKLGLTYDDYVKCIVAICNKYEIPVIDCYNTDFDLSYTSKRNSVYPEGDGVHPTLEGYTNYYLPVIEQSVILPDEN